VPAAGPRPYVKRASSLVLVGMGLFSLERFGLGRLESGRPVHLDPDLLSALVLAPALLVAAGAVVFVVGRLRRR
jgi:hypothetical protein